MPFAQEGRPGDEAAEAARAEAEEAKRLEEAHARAEAEQAALEQLKDENPEAYAKPEPEEGEGEGEGEEGGEAAPPRPPKRARSAWPRPHSVVRQARTPKYKTRGYHRCRRCGRPRAYYRKFGLCRICLRELAHDGYIPGMTKSSW